MAATLVKDDVLVVGAGPVGLVAACQLAKQGVRPRVIDALEQPTTESRAVAVHARSLEMLAALGVLPQLEARARRVVAVRMAEGTSGRQLAQVDLADLPSRHPYTLDVPQPDTEDALRERATELGVTVEHGVALTALAQDTDGVDVTLRALVSRGRATPELLDTYHAERHPVGAEVVRTTTAMTDVMTGTGAVTALRDFALFLVGHVHRIGRTAAAELAELTIDYRHSPLSADQRHHGRGATRAGARAPDPVGLTRPDSTTVAVEDLLARPGLLLLARTDDRGVVEELRGVLGDLGTVVQVVRTAAATDAPTTSGDVLVDPDDAVGRDYGLGADGIALVRPDGYLGLLAAPADPNDLRRYLQNALRIREVSRV